MDDELRALLKKPFDLGSFDKDIGWCGDWHTLTTEDDIHFHVLREGDENGVVRWTQRFSVTLETIDREAGALVLRGGAHELVFDLRAGAAVHSAFTPTGTISLSARPCDVTLEALLLGVAALLRELGPAPEGPLRVEWLTGAAPLRARLLAGTVALADVRAGGSPLQELEIDGMPERRLLLRWSQEGDGRSLHVVGEVLSRSAFLPLRRALATGLGWTPRPAFALRLLRELAADVLAAPEIVDPTTHAARGEALWAVREIAGALARLAPSTIAAAAFDSAIAGLTGAAPEVCAAEILAWPAPAPPDLRGFHADLVAWLDLEEALAAAPSRGADEASLTARLRATLCESAPPETPIGIVAALATHGAPPVAELRAWRP